MTTRRGLADFTTAELLTELLVRVTLSGHANCHRAVSDKLQPMRTGGVVHEYGYNQPQAPKDPSSLLDPSSWAQPVPEAETIEEDDRPEIDTALECACNAGPERLGKWIDEPPGWFCKACDGFIPRERVTGQEKPDLRALKVTNVAATAEGVEDGN